MCCSSVRSASIIPTAIREWHRKTCMIKGFRVNYWLWLDFIMWVVNLWKRSVVHELTENIRSCVSDIVSPYLFLQGVSNTGSSDERCPFLFNVFVSFIVGLQCLHFGLNWKFVTRVSHYSDPFVLVSFLLLYSALHICGLSLRFVSFLCHC